jgi:vacuolar-type H+-ATPase subunit I/STV1
MSQMSYLVDVSALLGENERLRKELAEEKQKRGETLEELNGVRVKYESVLEEKNALLAENKNLQKELSELRIEMKDIKAEFAKLKLSLAVGEATQKKLLLGSIAYSYVNAAVLYVFGTYRQGLSCIEDLEDEKKSKHFVTSVF